MSTVMERDDVEPVANERLDRFLTGTATVVLFVTVGAAAVLTWQSLLHWSDVIALHHCGHCFPIPLADVLGHPNSWGVEDALQGKYPANDRK